MKEPEQLNRTESWEQKLARLGREIDRLATDPGDSLSGRVESLLAWWDEVRDGLVSLPPGKTRYALERIVVRREYNILDLLHLYTVTAHGIDPAFAIQYERLHQMYWGSEYDRVHCVAALQLGAAYAAALRKNPLR